MNVKKIGLVIGIIILLLGSGFVIWASTPLGPSAEATAALQSTDQVTVKQGKFISFIPNNYSIDSTGLIFYPGGRVDPKSYAPLAMMIAQQGIMVVIVPMVLNLAVFSANKAQKVIDAYPDIQHWAIAGHSLGGSMAASFVHDHPNSMVALYLLASYAAKNDNISSYNITVLSIYGTHDQVLSEDMNATMTRLPSSAQLIPIEGGNHASFGNYGKQSGDGTATITRQQQQNITTTLIITSLSGII